MGFEDLGTTGNGSHWGGSQNVASLDETTMLQRIAAKSIDCCAWSLCSQTSNGQLLIEGWSLFPIDRCRCPAVTPSSTPAAY